MVIDTTRARLIATGLFAQESGERTIYLTIERPKKKRNFHIEMVFDGTGELIDVRLTKSEVD